MKNALSLHPKVAAGLVSGYVDADMPVEVGAAIVNVVAFVAGWLAPRAKEVPAEPGAQVPVSSEHPDTSKT